MLIGVRFHSVAPPRHATWRSTIWKSLAIIYMKRWSFYPMSSRSRNSNRGRWWTRGNACWWSWRFWANTPKSVGVLPKCFSCFVYFFFTCKVVQKLYFLWIGLVENLHREAYSGGLGNSLYAPSFAVKHITGAQVLILCFKFRILQESVHFSAVKHWWTFSLKEFAKHLQSFGRLIDWLIDWLNGLIQFVQIGFLFHAVFFSFFLPALGIRATCDPTEPCRRDGHQHHPRRNPELCAKIPEIRKRGRSKGQRVDSRVQSAGRRHQAIPYQRQQHHRQTRQIHRRRHSRGHHRPLGLRGLCHRGPGPEQAQGADHAETDAASDWHGAAHQVEHGAECVGAEQGRRGGSAKSVRRVGCDVHACRLVVGGLFRRVARQGFAEYLEGWVGSVAGQERSGWKAITSGQVRSTQWRTVVLNPFDWLIDWLNHVEFLWTYFYIFLPSLKEPTHFFDFNGPRERRGHGGRRSGPAFGQRQCLIAHWRGCFGRKSHPERLDYCKFFRSEKFCVVVQIYSILLRTGNFKNRMGWRMFVFFRPQLGKKSLSSKPTFAAVGNLSHCPRLEELVGK